MLTVYHGTSHDIDKFSFDHIRNPLEPALFFTDNPDEAHEWSSGNVYDVSLDTTDFLEVNYSDYSLVTEEDQYLYNENTMALIISQAKSSSAKGVIIQDVQNFEDGRITTTYVVFDLTAILSHQLHLFRKASCFSAGIKETLNNY